jgi:hypothetical protein
MPMCLQHAHCASVVCVHMPCLCEHSTACRIADFSFIRSPWDVRTPAAPADACLARLVQEAAGVVAAWPHTIDSLALCNYLAGVNGAGFLRVVVVGCFLAQSCWSAPQPPPYVDRHAAACAHAAVPCLSRFFQCRPLAAWLAAARTGCLACEQTAASPVLIARLLCCSRGG